MEIYLVRHGKTDWNENHLMQGRTDIELNETGLQEARTVKNLLKDIKFDKCYTSPLKRAIATTKIITDLDYTIDERLIERSFGLLEGQPITPLDVISRHWNCELNTNENEIEPILDLLERTKTFKDDLFNTKDNTILIISHGATSKALHYNLIGYDSNTDFLDFKLNNCEICKYTIDNNKVTNYEIIK